MYTYFSVLKTLPINIVISDLSGDMFSDYSKIDELIN